MDNATFTTPDLTTFCRLDELGLTVAGQYLTGEPTLVSVERGVAVSRIAAVLWVAWDTTNNAVLAEGHRLLIDKLGRFDDVTDLEGDEHVWRHTRRGDKYVTVVIDLTPVSKGTGSSRLFAMVEGRSKRAFKTVAAEELPKAATVMDPFHVIRLAGDALDICRRRVQVSLRGFRGRKHYPLYQARRILHTGADLLTDKHQRRLGELFGDDRRLPHHQPQGGEEVHEPPDRLDRHSGPQQLGRGRTTWPNPDQAT